MQFWRAWLIFFCSNSENFSLEDWKNLILLLQTFYKKYTCEPLECSFVNPSETLILKVQSFSVSFHESLYKFSAIWQNVPQDTSDAVLTTPKENVRSISKTFSIKVRKKRWIFLKNPRGIFSTREMPFDNPAECFRTKSEKKNKNFLKILPRNLPVETWNEVLTMPTKVLLKIWEIVKRRNSFKNLLKIDPKIFSFDIAEAWKSLFSITICWLNSFIVVPIDQLELEGDFLEKRPTNVCLQPKPGRPELPKRILIKSDLSFQTQDVSKLPAWVSASKA